MISNNLRLLLQGPANFFMSPLLVRDTSLGRIFIALVSAGVIAGVVRYTRVTGYEPIHCVLPFYLVLIALWNFPDASNRFYLIFLFLLVAGFWVELRYMFGLLNRKFRARSSTIAERFLVAIFAVAIMIGLVGMAVNYQGGHRRDLRQLSQQRRTSLKDKRNAYEWIARHDCCSPVLAYEDAIIFLYTGRASARPVIFPTSIVYDQKYLVETMQHVADIGLALDARYWVFSEDDFSMEAPEARRAIWNCLGRWGPSDSPLLFKSDGGTVVVRSVKFIAQSEVTCKSGLR
jgi:hypothetical protein